MITNGSMVTNFRRNFLALPIYVGINFLFTKIITSIPFKGNATL